MADTGPPWDLPYPLPTDLVRDGADAIKDLAEATASGLSNIPVIAGIGSNVVQTVKTDMFTTTSTSFETVTGLEVTITPTSATSKVLVLADVKVGDSDRRHVRIAGGNATSYVGDAAGGAIRGAWGGNVGSGTTGLAPVSVVYLDNPNTTDPVTYSVQVTRGTSGTVRVNRTSTTSNRDASTTASSITAIEVSA